LGKNPHPPPPFLVSFTVFCALFPTYTPFFV
jgi:hypothetical protein